MTMDNVTLAEFFEELIVALSKKNIALPLKDEQKWHTFLYNITTDNIENKPRFLNNIIFDWDAPYPKCQELSEFLQALHWNECINASNPSFSTFTIDSSLDNLCKIRAKDDALKYFIDSAVGIGDRHFARI